MTTLEAQPADTISAKTGSKSQQRMRDILRAGREVFAEKGYEQATAAEIAQHVGVSEATVFGYFRGKRELCARVIADWYDEIIAVMEAGVPLGASVRDQLAYLISTHLRLMLVNGSGLCAFVLSEGRTKQHVLNEDLTALQRRYTAPLMDVLARGQATGQVRTDMPLRLLRSMVFGPIEHVLWDATLGHRALNIEATAHQLTELLWTLLQPPAPERSALVRLHQDVGDALRRFTAATATQHQPEAPATRKSMTDPDTH